MKSNKIKLSKSDIFTGKIHQKFKPILGYSSRTYSTNNKPVAPQNPLTWSEWAAPYFTADYYYLGYGVAAAAAITTAYVSYYYIIPTASAYLYNNSTVANGNNTATNGSNASLDTVPRADYEALVNKLSQLKAMPTVPRADYEALANKLSQLKAIPTVPQAEYDYLAKRLYQLYAQAVPRAEYNALTEKLKISTQMLKGRNDIINDLLNFVSFKKKLKDPLPQHEGVAKTIIESCNKASNIFMNTKDHKDTLKMQEHIQYINNIIENQGGIVKIYRDDSAVSDAIEDAIVLAGSFAFQTGYMDMDPDTLNTFIRTVIYFVAKRYNFPTIEKVE